MFIRIKLFFRVFLLMVIVAGCKKSTVSEPPPVIAAKSQKGFISSSTTVNAGDSVKIAWVALRGAKNMTVCEVTTSGINLPQFNGGKAKDLQGDQTLAYTDSFKLKAVATRTYLVSVSAENGIAAMAITVIVPPNIKSYNSVVLTNTKDFFASLDGTLYGSDEFEANKSKIDITGAIIRGKAYLISSAQRRAEGLNTGLNGTITYFKVSDLNFITEAQPKNINNVSTNGGAQKIELKDNETYEFVNSLGQKGLIKIDTIIKGDIHMDVKVQE